MVRHGRPVFVVTGLTALFLALAGASEPSYVGAKNCKMCHIKQYKSWEVTKMAQSFELLKPGVKAEEKKLAGLDAQADYTADSECLPCHTTGYGKPGGFVSLAETPELAGVQCESCHGPGKDYLADDMMSLKNKEYKRDAIVAAGLVIPDSETCSSICHNDRSPFHKPGEAFDFESSKNEGTHDHIALKYPH